MRLFNLVFSVFCGMCGHGRWTHVTECYDDAEIEWYECLICGYQKNKKNTRG